MRELLQNQPDSRTKSNADFAGGYGKRFLRQNFPALYDALVRLRRARPVRLVEGAGNRLAAKRIVESGKSFDVDVCERNGFGASLSGVVTMHHFFRDAPGLRNVVVSNPLYLLRVGGDVLDQYFERKSVKTSGAIDAVIPFRNDYDLSTERPDQGLSIRGAGEIFRQNYTIKQEFLDQAAKFFSDNLSKPVGVHFRGSDKRFEAELVSWDRIRRSVDGCMDEFGSNSIFVATDEPAFLSFMLERYGSQRVRSLDCEFQAAGNLPAHFLSGDGFKKGQEALLTILLLSMCEVCVRGASHLSAWAKILNPDLPIVMLGKPFQHVYGFPDKEIFEEFMQGPLTHLAGPR
jgi:hypothetical protein